MDRCWCGNEAKESKCSGSEYHDPTATGRPQEIKRLYISGPMTGIEPDCNYPEFNKAAASLRSHGYEVVNPAEYGMKGGHYTDLLREDLQKLLNCDGVAVLENWWESAGARTEVQVAGLLKMPVRSVNEWINFKEEASVVEDS